MLNSVGHIIHQTYSVVWRWRWKLSVKGHQYLEKKTVDPVGGGIHSFFVPFRPNLENKNHLVDC